MRRALTATLLFLTTRGIGAFVPKERWYAASLSTARFLANAFSRLTPNTRNNPAASALPRLLHRHLEYLATCSDSFPIPTVIEGEEYLQRYVAEPGGFVGCSAHLPFVKLVFPVLHRVVGVTREIRIVSKDPTGHVSGWNDPGLEIIRADGSVLLHTRSFLRRNGFLLMTVDKDQGDVISANIFRFAGKLNSRVLLFFPRLLDDGRILLKFMVPPHPYCRSEEEIRENLNVVTENIDRILRGDKMRETHEVKAGEPEEPPADLMRELHRIQLYSDTQLESRIRRMESFLEMKSDEDGEAPVLRRRLEMLYAEADSRSRG